MYFGQMNESVEGIERMQDATTGMLCTTGLVAMFDILGYRALLASNPASEYVGKILEEFAEAPTATYSYLLEIATDGVERFIDLHELRILVFSDTILAVLPVPENEPIAWRGLRWSLFFAFAWKLYSDLFIVGLPLRGAVSYGAVVLHKMCFADQPIVEAYDLAQDIDAAVCVLTEEAAHERYVILKSLYESSNTCFYPDPDGIAGHEQDVRIICRQLAWLLRYQLPRAQVPRKTASAEKLCWVCSPSKEDKIIDTSKDLKQIVVNSFSAHKKSMTPDAWRKAQHTEEMLRYARRRQARLRETSTAGPLIVNE